MSKLTDEQIEAIYKQETGALIDDSPWALVDFSRAIEAAATEPLLQRIAHLEATASANYGRGHADAHSMLSERIAELERKSDQDDETIIWQAKKISEKTDKLEELEKALKLVQQHHATAWNRGHIAGMAANRMIAQDALNAVKKDAWNNTQLTEALMAAEGRCEELERQLEQARKDAERLDGLDGLLQGGTLTIRTANFLSAASRVQITYGEEDPIGDSFDIRAAIDAAMQKGKS